MDRLKQKEMPRETDLLKEVLALAQSLKSLSSKQMELISKRAPSMKEADLLTLKQKLLKIKEVSLKKTMENMEILRAASSAHKAWVATKARTTREEAEASEIASSQEEAEHLLSRLI